MDRSRLCLVCEDDDDDDGEVPLSKGAVLEKQYLFRVFLGRRNSRRICWADLKNDIMKKYMKFINSMDINNLKCTNI